MAESVREFFETAKGRLDPARTAGKTASYRFDIERVGSWHVDVDNGQITVTESEADADCVIRMSEETFLKLARGAANPTTAFITGKLRIEGDMGLALQLKDFLF